MLFLDFGYENLLLVYLHDVDVRAVFLVAIRNKQNVYPSLGEPLIYY